MNRQAKLKAINDAVRLAPFQTESELDKAWQMLTPDPIIAIGIPNGDWKQWATIVVDREIPDDGKLLSIDGEVFENRTRRIRELKDYLLGLMDV